MKATKKHISLETAKLLKDCGVDSKWIRTVINLTWQEILWEYAEEFFGGDNEFDNKMCYKKYKNITYNIINLLQQKKYEEADKYFRDNCILINNHKTNS